jgi:GrpB-like predicted nucleotidyltransferase (UPF0157 family)
MTSLICKHILGETSEEENLRIQDWLAKKEANRKYYNELRLILSVVDSTKYNQRYDSISAWTKIKAQITKH